MNAIIISWIIIDVGARSGSNYYQLVVYALETNQFCNLSVFYIAPGVAHLLAKPCFHTTTSFINTAFCITILPVDDGSSHRTPFPCI